MELGRILNFGVKILVAGVAIAVLVVACGGGGGGGGSNVLLQTWVSGSSTVNAIGVYGTQGVAATGNVPGARQGSISWIDTSGNLWLFGGYDGSFFNDLWEWNGTQWTWISGSSTVNAAGVYGTQGVPAPGNVPGAREGSVSWVDAFGNLWLFGGFGYSSTGKAYLNDLWKWNGSQWTWISGSSTVNASGVYGTQGVAAAGNVPGARTSSISWIDASGNLWLFGGFGYDSGGPGLLNDLWKWNGTQWTWVSGSLNSTALTSSGRGGGYSIYGRGVYGIQGVAAAGNVPGARDSSVSWVDASGNLWLFGGWGYDSARVGYLNDLWKWNGAQWTWVSGNSTVNALGVYGSQGIAAADNVPGARLGGVSWIDASGNLWLFGGDGHDSVNTTSGLFNDLWKWNGSQWTWMSGSPVTRTSGAYGTQGVAAVGNAPGSRYWAVSWIDASGNLWLFGGFGYDSAGTYGELNDLWKLTP